MATIDIVKEVLSENLDIEADKVVDEATFEELGVDSLDMVELVCDLEEKCEVESGRARGHPDGRAAGRPHRFVEVARGASAPGPASALAPLAVSVRQGERDASPAGQRARGRAPLAGLRERGHSA